MHFFNVYVASLNSAYCQAFSGKLSVVVLISRNNYSFVENIEILLIKIKYFRDFQTLIMSKEYRIIFFIEKDTFYKIFQIFKKFPRQVGENVWRQ